MKLISLLVLAKEPNPSGYIKILSEDGSFQGAVEGYAYTLLTSLDTAFLNKEVMRITMTTKAIFPVLQVYVGEE